MEINSSQNLSAATPLALPSSEKSSVLSSDFETFLKMLTAQAKYQDPLEPIDSSEYAAQLAQFSMVEQQVKSNDLLTVLADKLGGSSMADTASWIGMEARTATPAYFDGTSITVVPNIATGADEIYLSVYDASGTQVDRQVVPFSTDPFQWTGISEDGAQLANGTYILKLESYALGEQLSSEPPEIYSRITEARQQNGSAQIVLAGGTSIPASTITALREVQ